MCLANVDIDPRRPAETGLTASDLLQDLRRFRGERVLLFADCCYSGGLEDVAQSLHADGLAAAALTSASRWSASPTSTGNWTFTQVLIDLLAGDPLADRDGDGAIRFAEAGFEVEQAMK